MAELISELRPEALRENLARLHEEKGHRFLFEALPALRQRVGAVPTGSEVITRALSG